MDDDDDDDDDDYDEKLFSYHMINEQSQTHMSL